jgi:hypothetical protein
LIFVLVGAVLVGAAVFFYGLLRFQNGWDGLTMKEFAIWLIVVGTSAGALLSLIVARVTLPSVRRRTRFVILGALCGVLVGLVYGFSLEDVCLEASIKIDPCPHSLFFGREIGYFAGVAAWAGTAGIGGTILGLAAAQVARNGSPGHVKTT